MAGNRGDVRLVPIEEGYVPVRIDRKDMVMCYFKLRTWRTIIRVAGMICLIGSAVFAIIAIRSVINDIPERYELTIIFQMSALMILGLLIIYGAHCLNCYIHYRTPGCLKLIERLSKRIFGHRKTVAIIVPPERKTGFHSRKTDAFGSESPSTKKFQPRTPAQLEMGNTGSQGSLATISQNVDCVKVDIHTSNKEPPAKNTETTSIPSGDKSSSSELQPPSRAGRPRTRSSSRVFQAVSPKRSRRQPSVMHDSGQNQIQPVGRNIQTVERNIQTVERNIQPVERNIQPVERNIQPVMTRSKTLSQRAENQQGQRSDLVLLPGQLDPQNEGSGELRRRLESARVRPGSSQNP